MKFGKTIQKRQLDIPEYASHFVDYKQLKKLIKKLSATPVIPTLEDQADGAQQDSQKALQANRATFFFRVERELEKVNIFYLIKEAELKLRLKSLLEKKRVMQNQSASKSSSRYIALEEGFKHFSSDLSKLQQFVEINQTAFSKILKKWDKASKSKNKAVFLSCAVDPQPCFNRDVISELSDEATSNLLEFEAWAEGEKIQFSTLTVTRDATREDQDTDLESEIVQAANTDNEALLKQLLGKVATLPDAAGCISRAFLNAAEEAPEAALRMILESGLVDLAQAVEINRRNILHKGATSGRTYLIHWGLEAGVSLSDVDIWGRIPLHYTCIHGRVALAETLLEASLQTIDVMDHDGFTPLVHSIVHGRHGCVGALLSRNARVDPLSETDHVPLNLACQHGATEIVSELFKRSPLVCPDAEGLFPQHLVARASGSPELLLMLKEYGANLDQADKIYQWTPLFHAASEGNLKCLESLLQSGVNPDILDEKGHDALYYAIWERHVKCIEVLAPVTHVSQYKMPSSANISPILRRTTPPTAPLSATPMALASDADSIPPIVLPPPIIPVRRYGHNFLDTKTYVVVNFGNLGYDAIQFYNGLKYPAARLTISSKSSDLIPRNLLLPIPEDSRVIAFQIDDLDTFTIDFDVYPTFGAKVIARAVASSLVFTNRVSSAGHWHLEMLDQRLHAIGRISFNFQVVKPFSGIPLEITHFATYWKATTQLDTHQPSALITGSSLSGNYTRLFVQATSDGIIVLSPKWKVEHHGLEVPVCSITYEQFRTIGADSGHNADAETLRQAVADDVSQVNTLLAQSFVTLAEALEILSPDVNVELHALYPSREAEREQHIVPTLNVNDLADRLLEVVFDHARLVRRKTDGFTRNVAFSSFHADVCTALNWKQPNYPVLLCNELGIERQPIPPDSVATASRTTLSVKEAVQTAQNNNFMGLICSARVLELAPALVDSIKTAGLVLLADVSDAEATPGGEVTGGGRKATLPDRLDGVLQANGVLKFHASVDM